MIRPNNDSFFDHRPSKGVNSSYENVPESQHMSETYNVLNTRHQTVSAASSISQEKSNSEKAELYDPYDPGSSESESESPNGSKDPHGLSQGSIRGNRFDIPPLQMDPRRLSQESSRRGRYDIPPLPAGLRDDSTYSQPQDRSHQPALGPSARSMPTPGLPLSPLNAYGGRGANEGETSTHKKQAIGLLRMTPPRLKVDYQHKSAFGESGVDQIKAPPEITRKRSRSPSKEIDRGPFTCDLCAVRFSNAKALEEHLESTGHWETLEHIQQQNKYDDNAIAFLQEAMLHKVRQDNWVMDDKALEALQEKDYMTKQEMLHCAACKVYVSMSGSSVQHHLLSKDHLRNKEDFRRRQRRECVTTAGNMMEQLIPQYAHFLEGKDPFQ